MQSHASLHPEGRKERKDPCSMGQSISDQPKPQVFAANVCSAAHTHRVMEVYAAYSLSECSLKGVR
jgi:hypothetical protein